MASETSSYASSSLHSNDAPKELVQLLGILNKQQQEQQKGQHLPLHQQQLQTKQQQQQQQHVELSQIELIYRAEGNANLVLALPQFKKVLRLPKIQQKQQQQKQQPQYPDRSLSNQEYPQQSKQHQQQQGEQQQHEMKQQEPTNIALTATSQHQKQQQHYENAVGILTMDHYVAYIGIIRCLLGNEFVFEADIVSVPNPNDRDWINEHIRPHRPVNRLDKEFGGHYGLLLPDATRLPTEFDVLFSNLQPTTMRTEAATKPRCCNCRCTAGIGGGDGGGNNIFGEDTYAIEIKPKQGWLLPNDVNNLFDIRSTTAPTTPATGAIVPPVDPREPSEGTLQQSTNTRIYTGTQSKPSATIAATSSSPSSPALSWTAAVSASATKGNEEISHPLHGKEDIRCRYCSMQYLKLRQQKIANISNYCPLDLFSGASHRMLKAVDALFMCPQNNLRIFRNGDVIYDDQLTRFSKIEDLFSSDKLQLIKHLLVSCLLRDYRKPEEDTVTKDDTTTFRFSKEAKDAKQISAREKEIHVVASAGELEGVGEPHSSMTPCKRQKVNICTGDAVKTTTDPEVAKVNITFAGDTATTDPPSPSANTTRSCDLHLCCLCRPSMKSAVSVEQMNTPETLSLPKNCVLQKILHLQLLAKLNFQHMLDHKRQDKRHRSYESFRILLKKFTENTNKLEISQLGPEQQYLLAATALDCSIMITFRQLPCGEDKSLFNNPNVVRVNDNNFVTKVTVLDLDPKPDSHFAKYYRQTFEIMNVLEHR